MEIESKDDSPQANNENQAPQGFERHAGKSVVNARHNSGVRIPNGAPGVRSPMSDVRLSPRLSGDHDLIQSHRGIS